MKTKGGSKSSRIIKLLKEIGAAVRAARLRRDLTQEKAAERAGIHCRHWQRIEAGRANVTVDTLVLISIALDVPLETLIHPSAEPKPT